MKISPIIGGLAAAGLGCAAWAHSELTKFELKEYTLPLLARGAAMRFLLTLLASLLIAAPASADRIKDLGGFQGIRSNQLTGYGIVVGLALVVAGNSALAIALPDIAATCRPTRATSRGSSTPTP